MIHDDDLALRIEETAGETVEPGELLRGRYEPLEVAGRGGQGQVIRAWDHHHGRPVALKVRQLEPGVDRDAMLAEARMLVSLRPHQNIAIIRDDFFEGGEHYLVLDWISGEDLRTRLRSEGVPGVPFELVATVASDVAAALDHLHGHEPALVHGDVKPANIVLTAGDQPQAVLVDFGLATTGDQEASGGTLAYAAPEVLTGAVPTPAADVYSLAATTFELLTGRVPGPSATLDWSTVPSNRVASVRDALVSGLALDPDTRPRSARAFVDLLTSGTRADRHVLGRRRRRAARPLVLAGAIAVAAVSGAAIAIATDDDSSPSEEAGNLAAPSLLPAGEDEVGRLGIYSEQGSFGTYLVGEEGSLASHQLQTGLTSDWDAIVRLDQEQTLFYRSRDSYTVVVDWTADGAILDVSSTDLLVTGWTHLTQLRPLQLHLYDATTGNQALATVDEMGAVVGVTPLEATRDGWTHLTRLEDGRVLGYDAATGAASITAFDATGLPEGDTEVEGLAADLLAIVTTEDGRLVVGDGTAVRLLSFDRRSVTEVDEHTPDRPWTALAALTGGDVLVYDGPSGLSTVLQVDADGFTEGRTFDTSREGSILLGRV